MSLILPLSPPEVFPWFPPDERQVSFVLEDQILLELRESSLVNIPYRDNYTPPSLEKPWVVTHYKHGAKVSIPLSTKRKKAGGPPAKRGQIKGMSPKARRRAAFDFGNAPFAWAWMATLTYQVQPSSPGADWKRFLRALRSHLETACQYGWLMEYQLRGVIHYHIFFGTDFVHLNGFDRSCWVEPASGCRGETPVVRGVFDDLLVRLWCAACENPTPAFLAFQRQGIVEPLRSPDAAARYVAKETGKSHQKALPDGIDGGRRWWWLSPEGRPVREGTDKLRSWPLDRVTSTVFDKEALRGHYVSDAIRDDGPVNEWFDILCASN